MKINQKLLDRLDQSITQSFVQKISDERNRKADPEQFINQEQKGNFRVRQIGDEKQDNLKKSKCDAMSTATSNFYRDSESQMSTKPPTSMQGSKYLDQSKISSLKQSSINSRIASAQPNRPLLIKRMSKPLEGCEPKNEMKPMLIPLKRLGSGKQQQSQEQTSPYTQENMSRLSTGMGRRLSQTQKNEEKQEQTGDQGSFRQLEAQIEIKQIKKKQPIHEKIYETMDVEIVKEITQLEEDDFVKVNKIQFRFNTMNDSLYYLGELLPSLQELKLNYSQIESLRLLGTKLTNLRILWISNSKLSDISGINSMPQLVEFYCSFNNIKDLSSLAFHENLAILDIEGNEIKDQIQIEYLETLTSLQQLVISSNPITKNNELRQLLYEKISADIIVEEEEYPSQLLQEDNTQIQQLYGIAKFIDDNLDLKNVDMLRDLESKIRLELDTNLIDEPDEDRLVSLSIKQKPFEKQKLKRPQSAFDPKSELVYADEAFVGNPIKAAKQNKKNRGSDRPDIQALIDQYK